MGRLILYGVLGTLIGFIAAVIAVALIHNPSAGFSILEETVFGIVILCFLALGLMVAHWMNAKDVSRGKLIVSIPRTEQGISIRIWFVILGCQVALGVLFILALIVFPADSVANVLSFFVDHPLAYIATDIVFYILTSWIGVWYVVRKGHFSVTHSAVKISRNTVLLAVIPNLVTQWQVVLNNFVQNPIATIIGILLFMVPIFLALSLFLRWMQKNTAA